MADVFISYGREDKIYAIAIADHLSAQGWSVWWDSEVSAGTLFHDTIERELDGARCVVVIWTPLSVRRDWVKVEAEEGRQRAILVPLRIGDCKVPLSFRGVQTASCEDWAVPAQRDRCLEQLSLGVAAKVGQRSSDAGKSQAGLTPARQDAPTGGSEPIPEAERSGKATEMDVLASKQSRVAPRGNSGVAQHEEDDGATGSNPALVGHGDDANWGNGRAATGLPTTASSFARRGHQILVGVITVIAALGLWLVFAPATKHGSDLIAKGNGAFVWDESGQLIANLNSHGTVVFDASSSPSGDMIATVSSDSTLRRWDGRTFAPIGAPILHDYEPIGVTFGLAGSRILTRSWGAGRLWQSANGRPVGDEMRLVRGFQQNDSVVVGDDGRDLMLCYGNYLRISTWNAYTGASVSSDRVKLGRGGLAQGCIGAYVGPDRSLLLLTMEPRTVELWDWRDKARLWSRSWLYDSSRFSAMFSPDGQLVYVQSGGNAQLFAARTGEPVTRDFGDGTIVHGTFEDEFSGQMNLPAIFSADSKHLVSRSIDSTLTLWSFGGYFAEARKLTSAAGLRDPEFSQDGRRLLAISGMHEVHRWDVNSARPLGPPLRHEQQLRRARFSPDGRRVVTIADSMKFGPLPPGR